MTWVILPILIFCIRIVDVSLGTLRFILITRNLKYFAAITGFFEVLIWITVVKEIIVNVDNFLSIVAYAAGFAAGNFIGMQIIERLSIGKIVIRIITREDCVPLIENLGKRNYRVMALEPSEKEGKIHVIYTVTKGENTHEVISIVKENNPQAFYTIEDVREVNEDMFPLKRMKLFRSQKRRGK